MRKQKKPQTRKNPPVAIWIGLAAVAVLLVAALLLSPGRDRDAATYPREISVAQAAEKRNAGAFILDVREPSEWEAVHIPDATLIPLAELPSRTSELPKDQEIVIVCRSGNRSAQGRDILLQNGFETVTSMAGGMNDWQAQGFPTVTGP